MKLYRTHWGTAEREALSCAWDGTQSDARKRRAEHKKDFDVKTEEVAFPTAKEPLLEWLNKNCTEVK